MFRTPVFFLHHHGDILRSIIVVCPCPLLLWRSRPIDAQAETVEQWRQAVLHQLENLRAQPRQDVERSMWTKSGLGLGLPGWFVRPEGPPPALKAIDLRVVDSLLSNSVWVSCCCCAASCLLFGDACMPSFVVLMLLPCSFSLWLNGGRPPVHFPFAVQRRVDASARVFLRARLVSGVVGVPAVSDVPADIRARELPNWFVFDCWRWCVTQPPPPPPSSMRPVSAVPPSPCS